MHDGSGLRTMFRRSRFPWRPDAGVAGTAGIGGLTAAVDQRGVRASSSRSASRSAGFTECSSDPARCAHALGERMTVLARQSDVGQPDLRRGRIDAG
jgi:hypothetical protein